MMSKFTGILHAHSDTSYDGHLALPDYVRIATLRGLSFVCLTEHSESVTHSQYSGYVEACEVHSSEACILIPGLEYSFPGGIDLLALGMRQLVVPSRIEEAITLTYEAGGVPILAHPEESHIDIRLKRYHGCGLRLVEVWNGKYDGRRFPNIELLLATRFLNMSGYSLFGIGGVDAHKRRDVSWPLVGVTASDLSAHSILRSITDGYFTFGNRHVLVPATCHISDDACRNLTAHALRNAGRLRAAKKIKQLMCSVGLSPRPGIVETVRRFF